MNLKKNYYLFLVFFLYYVLSPTILVKYYQIEEFSIESINYIINLGNQIEIDLPGIYNFTGDRIYIYKKIHNDNYYSYEVFTISFVIIFLFVLYMYFKNIQLNYSRFIVKDKDQKIIFNFISIVCILFLLKDIILLINYYYSAEKILREDLYNLINIRKTYLNILIFVSVVNFRLNKKLSYFSYLSVLLYDVLSQSRYNIFILIILHFFSNVDLTRKNILKWSFLSFILLLIIFYRIIIQNKNILTFFLESFDIRLGSEITFENLKNITYHSFFIENIKFILRDFFYLDYSTVNFLQKEDIPIFSARGFDTIICYFFVFIIYIIILFFLIKNIKISDEFLYCINIFLLISLFRGNFVHNLNFIIKLYLLIFLIQWIIKILRQLKSKVV